MNGPSYQQTVAYINERDRQSRLTNEQSGNGGVFFSVLVLLELILAFVFGVTVLDNLGSESLLASKFVWLLAGVGGIAVYLILHNTPGIRWLMRLAMILLWAYLAYSLGQMVVGDKQSGFHLVSHKAPYVAATIAGFFRAIMYCKPH